MSDRIERAIAHLLGWHSVACLNQFECACPRGKIARIGAGPLGWHRWIDDPIQRLCSHRNPRNRGMLCSLPTGHTGQHTMGAGATWQLEERGSRG